jgi:hypothetical protein
MFDVKVVLKYCTVALLSVTKRNPPMPDPKKTKPTALKFIQLAAAVLIVWWPNDGHAAMNITPRLSTGVEYTDNFFLTNDNIGSEAESEWITAISPGVTVDITDRNASLALSYDPSYIMYDKYSDRDYWEHAVNLTGAWQPTRHLGVELVNDYLRTEDPIDEEDLTIRRGRNLYTRNTSSARIDYQFGAENEAYVDGLYSFLENEDPTLEDSERFGGSAGVIYWFNVRWGIDLGAENYRAEYEESDDFEDIVGRIRLNHRFNPHLTAFTAYRHTLHQFDDDINDYKIYDGSIGFEYAINPSTDLSLEVHYFVRDFDVTEDEAETPVNFDLTKRFQQGSISIAGEGGYDRTTVSAENLGYYVYYGGVISADYEFNRRVSGDVSAGWTYRDYKDEIPPREDDVYRAGCGLSFQLLRWLSARLGYTYRSVESNIEANDYVENRVSLLFTVAPEQPYRF